MNDVIFRSSVRCACFTVAAAGMWRCLRLAPSVPASSLAGLTVAAGSYLVMEFLFDLKTYVAVTDFASKWRDRLRQASADEGVAPTFDCAMARFIPFSILDAINRAIEPTFLFHKSSIVDEVHNMDAMLDDFVASCEKMAAFVPQAARVHVAAPGNGSEWKPLGLGSPSPIASNDSGAPLVNVASFDGSPSQGNRSCGGRLFSPPNGSLCAPPASPCPIPTEEDLHIQLLIAAIRKPDETVSIPTAPSGRSVSTSPTPQTASDALGGDVSAPAVQQRLFNESLMSPLRASSVHRSMAEVGSPRISPAAAAASQRWATRGTFRKVEKVTDMSSEHVGTVLCVDIEVPRDSEGRSGDGGVDREVVEQLSEVMGQIINIILEYGGVVYYFDLSRLVATFHVLQPCVDHARLATFAGLAVSHLLEPLSEAGYSFGIGISFGIMLAGDMGTEQVRTFIVYGAVVQEAMDLAKLNYCLQTRVLISEAVQDLIQGAGVITMLVDFVGEAEEPPMRAHFAASHSPRSSESRRKSRSVSKGVFEVRGSDDSSFTDSFVGAVESAPRLSHETLVAYLEAFFFLRKGQFGKCVERLLQMNPESIEDPQVQRLIQLAIFLRDVPQALPEGYSRLRFERWEGLEFGCDGPSTRQASPSYAGKSAAKLSHESPTRIIEAVMRARSTTPQPPSELRQSSSLHDPPSLEGTITQLNLTVSSEFSDVAGARWRKSEKILGKGAFGEVYLGMRVDDGKLVAMKQLKIPEIVQGSNGAAGGRMRRTQQREKNELDALVREIKMLCHLRHPNIVFFLGCGVVNHDILINLEYVSGGSLQSILEEFGVIPVPAAQRYLKDVLRGLDFLHTKGIIHRDVKPANVLLHVDGGCKVTDFGTSIQIQNILDNNIVVGTPAYMSPEQAMGSKTTCIQSDLWSVGIMTIQLLTGSAPFDLRTAMDAHQHMHRLATDPNFEVPIPKDTLPQAAISFVSQCLRRDPAARGHAQELLLHPFLFSVSTPSHPTPMRRQQSAFSSSPNSEVDTLSPHQPIFLDPGHLQQQGHHSHQVAHHSV